MKTHKNVPKNNREQLTKGLLNFHRKILIWKVNNTILNSIYGIYGNKGVKAVILTSLSALLD